MITAWTRSPTDFRASTPSHGTVSNSPARRTPLARPLPTSGAHIWLLRSRLLHCNHHLLQPAETGLVARRNVRRCIQLGTDAGRMFTCGNDHDVFVSACSAAALCTSLPRLTARSHASPSAPSHRDGHKMLATESKMAQRVRPGELYLRCCWSNGPRLRAEE